MTDLAAQLAAPRDATGAWRGCLTLAFAAQGARTVLARRQHSGPLLVQRPFYPEGAPCHVYLLHPPGGVVGGDELELTASVDTGAQALITTPASSKFYRSSGATARLTQRLQVARGGVLEWLPQDSILYAGCAVDMQMRVELAPGAAFIGWEILCLGRPGSGEPFSHGVCRQRFELWRDGQPRAIERSRFSGDAELCNGNWGLAGHTVSATLLATPADKTILHAVRAAVDDALFGATLLDDVLVCRYLGDQGLQARAVMQQAWDALRPLLLGRPACAPRIWQT